MLEKLWFLLLFPGLPVAGLLLWIKRWMTKRDTISRRPFKDMPRPAAWSLRARTDDLMSDALMHAMMICLVGAIAWTWYLAKGDLGTALTIGLLLTLPSLYLARKTLRSYSNHKLGLLGEQLVGGVLDRLSSDHLHVFHDLLNQENPKKPWNIDHIALTPAGVFLFETKTRRKMLDANPADKKGHKVTYDGVHLHFPPPMRTDRHGIEQAERSAAWLSKRLTALNGTEIPVTAALVLPGWFIDRKAKGPVSVLNEKEIKTYLANRPATLTDDRFLAISSQLQDMTKVEIG